LVIHSTAQPLYKAEISSSLALTMAKPSLDLKNYALGDVKEIVAPEQ
jgi:hypothetical protein